MAGRPKGSKNKPQRALQQAIEARLKRVYGKEWDVILESAYSARSTMAQPMNQKKYRSLDG